MKELPIIELERLNESITSRDSYQDGTFSRDHDKPA